MKILWVSHLVPYPPKGGVLQRSYNLLRELSRYHEVTLLCFNQSAFLESSLPGVSRPLEFAVSELSNFVDVADVLDIPENIYPLGRYLIALKSLLSRKAFNMTWLESASAHRAIKLITSEREFDAVHLDTISLCVYWRHFSGIPVYLNHHNFESQMLRSRAISDRNPLKRFFFGIEANRLVTDEMLYCKEATLNLACSDDDTEGMVQKTGCKNFLTIPNGVDVEYFYPNEDVSVVDKSLLIVGGLSWYPNREAVEYFINDIWPALKDEVLGLHVDIIGRNPTKEMIEFSESEASVQFHGFVDDVRDYLWKAQIYICPIKTGGGTKLKILDALAAGCCIVADPFSCKGIAVEDGRHVFFAETPEDYVSKIKFLLDNPNARARAQREGPRLIRKSYDYTSIGKLYSDEIAKRFYFANEVKKNIAKDAGLNY